MLCTIPQPGAPGLHHGEGRVGTAKNKKINVETGLLPENLLRLCLRIVHKRDPGTALQGDEQQTFLTDGLCRGETRRTKTR